MENTDDELTNDKTEEMEDDYQLIDPNDLIIIDDPDNWKPTEEITLAYATLLGYDPNKDPKEILKIAEKYLTCKIDDNMKRAFMRDNYRILYIDMNTQEITLESDLETKAKEEFEECRKKSVIKPPVPFQNNFKSIDEELKKKMEDQKRHNDSMKNSAENIQIIDEPSDEEKEEDKKIENKKNDESSSEHNNINNENNINIKNNTPSKKEQKNDYDDYFDDDAFNESSKTSNDNDIQKTIKSQKFDEIEEIKEKEEEKFKEERKVKKNSNKKNDDIINIRDIPKKKEKSNLSKENFDLNLDNSSDEDNFKSKKMSDKKNQSKEKKKYLDKTKMTFKKYKNKLKQDYINKKNDFREKNIDNITENLKKKKTLQMSEVSLEDLDFYETSLKQKMEQELNKFKKNLITTYEYKDLNSSVEIDLEQKLEIKKKKVESDIRIQKERNKNKLENEQNKNKILLEKKIVDLEELNKSKKSRLNTKHKNDINSLEKEFQIKYEQYINEYKNKDQNNKGNNDLKSNDILKNNLNELEQEYMKELKEEFEQEKISINYQIQSDMLKELENYKTQIKYNRDQELQKINDRINNLGNDYFTEKNLIKKELDIQKEKDELYIKEKLQKISGTFFSEIKNRYLNKLNEEMKQISSLIKQNNNNKEQNENIEIKVEEKLIDNFVIKNSKLSELKSIYDLTEKDYNEIKLKIEYISKAISVINKLLIEKGSNFSFDFNLENKNENKDDSLVNEIILKLQNKLEEFKIKNKDNIDIKIYPFLDDEINNLMENIRKSKENNIIRNNNYYFTKNAKFTKNNFFNNDDNINNNIKLNPQFLPNYNPNKFKNNLKRPLSYDRNNYNNNSNNGFFYLNNNFQENGSIKFNNNKNINLNIRRNVDENNLELPEEILNNFSEDLLYLYNKIISFLREESSSIENEKQNLNKQENINNNLKNFKDTENLRSYKNDFNFILSQEQRTSRNFKRNIEDKIRLYNKIKSSWEETLDFIYNNISRLDSIRMKFNIISENINDYKTLTHSNKKDIFGERMYNNHYNRMNNFMENNNYNVFNSASKNQNNFRYGGNNLRYSSLDRKYN